MATTNTRAKKAKDRRPKGDTERQNLQILWTLKLDGDINENHAGGNANKTFNERLGARGAEIDPKDVYNRLYHLERTGKISRLTENHKCYAIRLLIAPEDVGPNPFPPDPLGDHLKNMQSSNGNGKTDFVFDLSGVLPQNDNGAPTSLQEMIATMSVRERLQLAAELIAGAKGDLDALNI